MADSEGANVLARADPEQQESLEAFVEPDMLDQEQTFPTEEELRDAEDSYQKMIAATSQKKVRCRCCVWA